MFDTLSHSARAGEEMSVARFEPPDARTGPKSLPFAQATEELQATTTVGSNFATPPVTHFGADVLSIYARACEWAHSERHAAVTVDHLLLALVNRQTASAALATAGVSSITSVDDALVSLVHRMPIAPLSIGQKPIVENAVVALLQHAQGHARQNGRDMCGLTDLLESLLDALRRGEPATPGMAALRSQWPKARNEDPVLQLLTQIREEQRAQPQIMANVLSRELRPVSEQVSQLRVSSDAPPPVPQKRLLPKLLPQLGLWMAVVAVAGMAAWSQLS